jgi:hypothetical protein
MAGFPAGWPVHRTELSLGQTKTNLTGFNFQKFRHFPAKFGRVFESWSVTIFRSKNPPMNQNPNNHPIFRPNFRYPQIFSTSAALRNYQIRIFRQMDGCIRALLKISTILGATWKLNLH